MTDNSENIWKKLFGIQKSFRTFNADEDSEKKDGKGNSAYKYTPGWKIIENIREKMDEKGLMLIQEVTENHSQVIEYPVYKIVDGTPKTFNKKEIYVELTVQFTWRDVETGETAGPFTTVSSGANGTDKSLSSAMATAERYFLLKFFRITTREASDEPDAHDSDTIQGIPQEIRTRQQGQERRQAPAPVPQQPPVQPYVAQPYTIQGPAQPPLSQKQELEAAINKLMYYEKGTSTHQQVLNGIIGDLTSKGINCFLPNFLDNLSESAQARRENRMPNLK